MVRWIVCSAWPYINSVPHLGTFMHLVSADVYARYLKLKGEDVVSVSGSDEHGTPIEVEAIKKGLDAKELSDKNHRLVTELLERYSIELDNYTRTESDVHKKFVQQFYMKLLKNGYIFDDTMQMLYCGRCKRFLPDRFVVGTCPYCGYPNARGDQCENCGRLLEPTQLIDPRCAICGSTPEMRTTRHWFFDLPRLEAEVAEYLQNNTRLPDNARKMSLNMLKEGLRSRAVTRDNRWGIPAPFPGAEGKTIYVWMEAVLGYLSAVLEWAERKGDPSLFERFWKSPETRAVCFIGKDNIPFHTIIFPALLLASHEGFALPWQVSSTEYIMMEGRPFSKSRGVGVWMDHALDVADGETWRFALMYLRPETRDANFTWNELIRIVNRELNDNLGNFIHRTLTLIFRLFNGQVPDCDGTLDENAVSEIGRSIEYYSRSMDSYRLRDATRTILDLSRKGNEYLSRTQPWEKAKENMEDARYDLCVVLKIVEALALLIYPVMPGKAMSLWRMLGHDTEMVSHGLSLPKGGKRTLGRPRPLFNKIPEDPEELARIYKEGEMKDQQRG